MRMGKMIAAGVLASVLPAAGAMGSFDLQITELWPGNEPGENLTEDWIEVTNFGDMAWTAAADGDLWFDDDSFDATAADLMSGVASIAPGESVIFVDGSNAGRTEWLLVWSPEVSGVQVGYYEGSGMSQGGDGAGIFLDGDMSGTVIAAELIDSEVYPDAELFGGQSYDVTLGAFSTVGNASGAISTLDVNDEDQPGIASPGTVPEPASLALLALGGAALLGRRRG